MTGADDEAEARKAARRAKRNLRTAHAKGLMQGILSMLRPGDVVLDCGANVGDVSEPLAQTGATVHAFEPDPWAFAQLSARLEPYDNVTLHNAAVGARAGRITLHRAANFDDNPKGGSVKSTILTGGRNIEDGTGIEVEIIDLTALLRRMHADGGEIAFLKMDIEGAELEVLEAMEAGGLFDLVRLTVAETHEHKFKDLRPRFKALRSAVGARYPITRVNLDWI